MTTFSRDEIEKAWRGREAILAWLVPVMERCKGWTFPVEWLAIDGNRSIRKWQNRLPGQRPDGSHYEFAGISISVYCGSGQFSFQEDIYNWEESLKVLKEWAAAQKSAQA